MGSSLLFGYGNRFWPFLFLVVKGEKSWRMMGLLTILRQSSDTRKATISYWGYRPQQMKGTALLKERQMAMQVCAGAMLQCSFGTAPSALIVTPENKVLTTTPDANIMDHKPIKNIVSFVMCTTQSNRPWLRPPRRPPLQLSGFILPLLRPAYRRQPLPGLRDHPLCSLTTNRP